MAYQQVLSTLSGMLVISAVVLYIVAILRGFTKPSKASWTVWAILCWITAAGMYQADALNIQIAVVAVCDSIIVLLAFKYGNPGWSAVDKWSIAGAAVGIALWVGTGNPLFAVVIALTVNFVGSIPTYVKTWHYPEQESATAWILIGLSSLTQSLAIPAWTVADAAQPISFVAIQAVQLILIFVRPKRFFATA